MIDYDYVYEWLLAMLLTHKLNRKRMSASICHSSPFLTTPQQGKKIQFL